MNYSQKFKNIRVCDLRSYIRAKSRFSIYRFLNTPSALYPNFNVWLEKKIDEIEFDNSFSDVLVNQNSIVGIIISTKKSRFDSKICNIFISNEYRGYGLGKILLKHHCERLKVANFENIYLTCSDDSLNCMSKFLDRNRFNYREKIVNKYKYGKNEYIYWSSLY